MFQSVTIQAGNATWQFLCRPGTSDDKVIHQVFTAQHYSFDRLNRRGDIQRLLAEIREAGQRPLVIDAGANIGASSLYFSVAIPGARVIAVEPEPGNFDLLSRNTQGADIHCVPAALGPTTGKTRLADPGMGHWCYRTATTASGPEVDQVTVPDLIAAHAGGAEFRPFLAKIDIEGGEKELFEGDTRWLAAFPIVIVELHDWLIPRGRTAPPFLRAVAALDRDFVCIGENVFSIDNAIGAQS